MTYREKCIKKFKTLPEFLQMAIENDASENFIKKISEDNNGIDIKFLAILVAIGELAIKDIPEYLKLKFNLSSEKALEIKEELNEHIFMDVIGVNDMEEYSREKEFGSNGDFKKIEELFNNLYGLLFDNNRLDIKEINKQIILMISLSDNQLKLVKNIEENEEKITHKHFVLEGKPRTPSVGNWLRDFIKRNGTEMFDNVVLTKYITNSPNAKRLDENERRLLTRLLLLYRNLKFFPESMRGVPVEQWEIIPIERREDNADKLGKISGPPRTKEEKKINELKAEEEKYARGGLEERAIEEEINQEKQIENLRIEANKYPAGSLEKRAIEEEIRNLSN